MEEHVPRTPWRRRRTTDSPRPAGRRWAGRLRRSGTIARQALTVRVGRRRADSGRAATAVRSEVLYTGSDLLAQPRPVTEGRRVGPAVEPARLVAPALLRRPRPGTEGRRVGPAVEPARLVAPAPTAEPATSLLPGEHTVARRA